MRIGVLILPAQPWSSARRAWQHADELGFAHAWTYDHIVWRDLAGRPWFASIPTLTAAAATTVRIGLGALVFSPNFRHPAQFAKELLTLADISGGRLVAGIGAGAGGLDAAVLGDPPLSPAERADRFAEFVTATDRLMRVPGANVEGRHYRVRDAHVTVAATGVRPPPLAIAAAGPRGMRLVARFADFWVTNGAYPRPGVAPAATPELIRRQSRHLDEACERAARDPASVRRLFVNVNRDDPPLASIEAFRDAAGRYAEAGVTDMVVPYPRAGPPFAGDEKVLEAVAAEQKEY